MEHLTKLHCNGKLLALSSNIRLRWLIGSCKHSRAYYVKATITAVKSFIVQTPGVNVIKLFFPSLLMSRPNKLEGLYLAITFQSSPTFAGNPRSLPKKEGSERCSHWVGSGLALKF